MIVSGCDYLMLYLLSNIVLSSIWVFLRYISHKLPEFLHYCFSYPKLTGKLSSESSPKLAGFCLTSLHRRKTSMKIVQTELLYTP